MSARVICTMTCWRPTSWNADLQEKDLAAPVDNKLITTQNCDLVAKVANTILGSIRSCKRVKAGDISPLLSTGEATSEVLGPVRGQPMEETWTYKSS